MSEQTISALKRISKLAIAEVGDACKNDLIHLAYASGLADNQIHSNFPEFFSDSDFSDIETYHDTSESEEENTEEEGEKEEQDEDETEKEEQETTEDN